ncbi:unnamed protein product, partial [Didymodactylos carnosus]
IRHAYTCAKWSSGIDLNLGTWKFGDPVLSSQQASLRRKMDITSYRSLRRIGFQQKEQHLKKKRTKSSTTDPELTQQTKEQQSSSPSSTTVATSSVTPKPVVALANSVMFLPSISTSTISTLSTPPMNISLPSTQHQQQHRSLTEEQAIQRNRLNFRQRREGDL